MSNFITHVELGFKHVLDFNGYDHILFLIVLAVIFSFSQWKKVLLMITFFTVGHTFTLGLATYQIVTIKETVIEFLIPITILITAVVNILKFSINSSKRKKTNLFFALFFGLIHGLGFSNFLRVTLGRSEDKLIPMLEFALGIELAQIVIVLSVLILGTVLIHFFRVSKRDWVVITSAIVIGITIPIIRDSYVAWSS
ncbi:MAG: HupE/UreJ family protein [Flavobacteriales bacterium]|nr:HupE/UreJ family protein [Flavobacteriales bacterium]